MPARRSPGCYYRSVNRGVAEFAIVRRELKLIQKEKEMNCKRVVRYGLWMVLSVLAFSVLATAGTTCTQTETCTTSNTCDAGDCMVRFSRNSTSGSVIVEVMIGGNWQTIPNNMWFCVPPGAMVNWTTKGSEFFARFAPSSNPSPFANGQNTVLGTATAGVGLTTISPAYDDCHSFAVATCDVSPTATGLACGTADPKVVINGGGPFHKGKGKDKDKDRDKD